MNSLTYIAKGTIWNIIGLIVKKFPQDIEDKLEDIQRNLFLSLTEQFYSKKPGDWLFQPKNINNDFSLIYRAQIYYGDVESSEKFDDRLSIKPG